MANTNIKKLQNVDLQILKEVVSICDDNGLTYYMIGGTFLGAIRHKGFIPWDDDIDIGMPRGDYEKFLEIGSSRLSSNLEIVNYKTSDDYQYYITRVRDKNTKLVEIRIGNESKYTHASIDIFPLDGSPNNVLLRKLYYFRIMALRAIMSLCYKDSIDWDRKRGKIEQLFLTIMLKLPIDKLFDPRYLKDRIDKIMRKYSPDNSELIGCLMGAYRTGEMVPRSVYGRGAYYDFEDIKLRGPEHADEFLKIIYGDYMKLPPEEDRKVHFRIIEIEGEKIDY